VHHFAAAIENLRMATKYSFHIRPAAQKRLLAGGTRSSNPGIGIPDILLRDAELRPTAVSRQIGERHHRRGDPGG